MLLTFLSHLSFSNTCRKYILLKRLDSTEAVACHPKQLPLGAERYKYISADTALFSQDMENYHISYHVYNLLVRDGRFALYMKTPLIVASAESAEQ